MDKLSGVFGKWDSYDREFLLNIIFHNQDGVEQGTYILGLSEELTPNRVASGLHDLAELISKHEEVRQGKSIAGPGMAEEGRVKNAQEEWDSEKAYQLSGGVAGTREYPNGVEAEESLPKAELVMRGIDDLDVVIAAILRLSEGLGVVVENYPATGEVRPECNIATLLSEGGRALSSKKEKMLKIISAIEAELL